MKPAVFVHHEPRSLDEALARLAEVAEKDGRVLAGGQTLVPAMALRLARPAHLVDINRIESLGRLVVEAGCLVIGARVRHAAFHRPVVGGPLGCLLTDVVRHIAHLPVRTRGTFCGSLANADPASEWCLVATSIGTIMVARSVRGARSLTPDDFFQGFMETALAPDEILVEARLPLLSAETRFGFEKFSRRAGDFAQAMALAIFEIRDGAMTGVRLGIGGVEGAARRLAEAEARLEGRPPSFQAFRDAAEAASAAIEPADATAPQQAYKRDLVRALARRALERTATGVPREASDGGAR